MANMGILGAEDVGMEKIFRSIIQAIQLVNQTGPADLVISRAYFPEINGPETLGIRPYRVIVRDNISRQNWTIFGLCGDRTRPTTRMLIITIGRISSSILIVFDLSKDLDDQMSFFNTIRYMPRNLVVGLLLKEGVEEGREEVEIIQGRITQYFRNRGIRIEDFVSFSFQESEAVTEMNIESGRIVLENLLDLTPSPRKVPERNKETVSESDREYYKSVHGFDPVEDRIPLLMNRFDNSYRYEKEFQLVNDPALQRAGVTIWAEVIARLPRPTNRIIFRRGDKRSEVYCIHTAICTIPMDEEEIDDLLANGGKDIVEYARTTEREPVDLSPEEHFASLKSYVAGIAELGIENMLLASYYSEQVNPVTMTFGFNTIMQKQVIQALHKIAPKSTISIIRNVFVELVSGLSEGWVTEKFDLLDGVYHLREVFFTDLAAFDALIDVADFRVFYDRARVFSNTSPEIWNKYLDFNSSR